MTSLAAKTASAPVRARTAAIARRPLAASKPPSSMRSSSTARPAVRGPPDTSADPPPGVGQRRQDARDPAVAELDGARRRPGRWRRCRCRRWARRARQVALITMEAIADQVDSSGSSKRGPRLPHRRRGGSGPGRRRSPRPGRGSTRRGSGRSRCPSETAGVPAREGIGRPARPTGGGRGRVGLRPASRGPNGGGGSRDPGRIEDPLAGRRDGAAAIVEDEETWSGTRRPGWPHQYSSVDGGASTIRCP
jgi:hypothetical protein